LPSPTPDDLLGNALPIAGKVGRRTVGQWLGNFTARDDLRHALLHRARLGPSSPFREPEQIRLRRPSQDLRTDLKVERDSNRALLRDFVAQTVGGKLSDLRNVGIVDSGWAGTTQNMMRAVLPEAPLISGVYLGIRNEGRTPSDNSQKYGLLRDDYHNTPHQNILQGSAGVVRSLGVLAAKK
jgi:hypothetical protein